MSRRILPIAGKSGLRILGSLLLLLWGFLTAISFGIDWSFLPASWQSGFAYDIENDRMPTAVYLAVHSVAVILLGVAAFFLAENRSGSAARTILVFAVAMRLLALWGEPIHESDFYRYVWDGKSSLAGVNPYRFEPGALQLRDTNQTKPFPDPETSVVWRGRFFTPEESSDLNKLDALRASNPVWYERISHQAVPTIYPPAAQAVFALSAGAFGWSVLGLKAIVFLFDIGTIVLLLSILRRLGENPSWAVLYAWHPLVVKEFANSAHYDAVPIFFCMLALWIAVARPTTVRSAVLLGVVLALGTLAKYFAVLLLPILLWKGSLDRRVLAGAAAFASTVFLGFWPFALWAEVGWSRLFEGLRIYSAHWQYNPGGFAVLRRLFELAGDGDAFRHANIICAILLCGVVSWMTFRSRLSVVVKSFAAMGALFVLSPTAFPWYLCWAIAFLPLRPRWSWLVLSLLIPLNYLDFKSEAVAPIAFSQIGGFYVLSGTIWVVFATCWIVENTWAKSRCPMAGNGSR